MSGWSTPFALFTLKTQRRQVSLGRHCYDVFLSVGTEELKASAMRLARQKLKGHETLELKYTGRTLKHPATHGLRGFSLGYAIEILVSSGISSSDILDDGILFF